MTDYVYKSTTGRTVRAKNYSVTVEPGLLSDEPIEVLDQLIGTKLVRYDDGILRTTDPESEVLLKSGSLVDANTGIPITVVGGNSVVTSSVISVPTISDIAVNQLLYSSVSGNLFIKDPNTNIVEIIGGKTTVEKANTALQQNIADGRYVRTVNGIAPDSNGDVVVASGSTFSGDGGTF